MKKSFLLFVFGLFFSFLSLCQVPDLVPYLYGNKWGYVDPAGTVRIKPAFDQAGLFNEGRAIVRLNYSFGVIDKSGKIIIPAKYDKIEILKKGFYIVRLNNSYGLLDENLKEWMPVIYQNIETGNGIIYASIDNRFELRKMDLSLIIPGKVDQKGYILNFTWFTKDDKFGVIDSLGRILLKPEYDNVMLFYSGWMTALQNSKWGIFDPKGKLKYPFEYDTVISVANGRGFVKKDGKYWLTTKEYKPVRQLDFTSVRKFYDGRSVVMKNDKWGAIDINGNLVIPCTWSSMANFKSGYAQTIENHKFGLINREGKVIFTNSYFKIDVRKNNIVVDSAYKLVGLFDLQGKQLYPFQLTIVNDFFNGIAAFRQNDKIGYLDESGKIVIPAVYDLEDWETGGYIGSNHNFLYDHAVIKLNGKFGMINARNEVVIPIKYDALGILNNSFVEYRENNKSGLMTITGKVVTECNYEDISKVWETTGLFKCNLDQNTRGVFLDENGRIYYAPVNTKDISRPVTTVPVMMDDTELRKLVSKNNGTEYQIEIALPEDYYSTNKNYPVIYLTDADMLLGTVRESVKMISFDRSIPSAIIVGISYGGNFNDWYKKRIPDLCPTDDKTAAAYPGGGEADKFLLFIKNELMPLVDSVYRTKKGESVFTGYSLGGLFGAYVLFNDPALFKRYILISPSFWWDKAIALSWEETYAASHKNLDARVFISLGSEEYPFMKAEDMYKKLLARNYPSLIINYESIPNESHFTTFQAAFVKGIKKVFYKEKNEGLIDY